HPGQPHDRLLEARSTLAPLVEPGTDPLDVGDEIASNLVHDVVAEPLEKAHDRLGLAEQAALLVAHEPLQPVAAVALTAKEPAELSNCVARQNRDVAREGIELPLQSLGQVGPEPAVRLELEGVGR